MSVCVNVVIWLGNSEVFYQSLIIKVVFLDIHIYHDHKLILKIFSLSFIFWISGGTFFTMLFRLFFFFSSFSIYFILFYFHYLFMVDFIRGLMMCLMLKFKNLDCSELVFILFYINKNKNSFIKKVKGPI